MIRTPRSALALLALAPLAALTGCRAGYEVDVRNLTDQPVSLRLATGHTDGAPLTLRTDRLGPGDRGSMFVQTDAGANVILEADFQGNVGHPATIDLAPGKTVVNVVRPDEGSRGTLRLEEVPRP